MMAATLRLNNPAYADFYKRNPDFDILRANLMDDREMAALQWSAKSRSSLLDGLRSYQRLLRVHPDEATAQILLDAGYDSAHRIAATPEHSFIALNTQRFNDDKEFTRRIHRQAVNRKAHTMHLWAALHGSLASPHARAAQTTSASDDLVTFFEGMPSYTDMFGSLNYCECEHCQSILGPAAYFVDLMRITEEYITLPNQTGIDSIDPRLTLQGRRPLLFELPITCANTNDLIPYIRIVNEVLAAHAAVMLGSSALAQTLAAQVYPFNLPFNQPLHEIRAYLDNRKTSLAEIYKSFAAFPNAGTVQGATSDVIVLDSSASAEDGVYGRMYVTITSGKGAGQSRLITAYDADQRLASVSPIWTTIPDSTSHYLVNDARNEAEAYLNISSEEAAVYITPRTTDSELKQVYGLGESQSLSDLNSESKFLYQTGLSRADLHTLLYQNLSDEELSKGLAHGFYINQPLPETDFVQIAVNETDPQLNTIENLTNATLDRINRFVRCAQKLELNFIDFNWLLTSLPTDDIDAAALVQLADVERALARFSMSVDELSSCWYDMKTIGLGSGRTAEDLFDRVYNNPTLLNGQAPYHPDYSGNPLYQDPVQSWNIAQPDTPETVFGRGRLMAALRLSDAELTTIATNLFGPEATIELTVTNLSMLYRAALICRVLRLAPEDYFLLLAFLGIDDYQTISIAELLLIADAVAWIRASRLSFDELNFVINGVAPVAGITPITIANVQSFMQSFWVQALPVLLKHDSFVYNNIDADESRAIFSQLQEQGLIVNVTAQYASVFDSTPDAELAFILEEAGASNLDFLRNDPALDLSDDDIAYVHDALVNSYASQNQFLNEQLAVFFGVNTSVTAGLAYYTASLSSIDETLGLMFTPVPSDDSAWTDILATFETMARLLPLALQLGLTYSEMRSIADNPAAYNLQAAFPLTLADIYHLFSFKKLAEQFNDRQGALASYLSMPADDPAEVEAKLNALAALSSWSVDGIIAIARYYGDGAALYNSVSGLNTMNTGFAIAGQMGVDIAFFSKVLTLRSLPATGTSELGGEDIANWTIYESMAQALKEVANAPYSDEEWKLVDGRIRAELDEALRDVLLTTVQWQYSQRWDVEVTARSLYEYLLIDVSMSGCAEVSRIKEGINAVQLYLQRCRLNQEPGVKDIPIPEVWWDWMMNYRVWEANRRIFLYPENYLDPSLRQSKTELFERLQNELLQNDVTEENVSNAFQAYMDGFARLASLVYVDAYRCKRALPGAGERETLFLFARTETEPYEFYYITQEANALWKEWRKIELSINAQIVTPVYAFDKLFLFWVEKRVITNSEILTKDGNTDQKNSSVYKASIKYSCYNFNGEWLAPQTLVEDLVTNFEPDSYHDYWNAYSGVNLYSMDSLYWNKVNLIRLQPENYINKPPNGKISEKLLLLYGPFVANNVTAHPLTLPPQPDPGLKEQNQDQFTFEESVYQRIYDVNQAVDSTTRGYITLQPTLTLNDNFTEGFVLEQTEFIVFTQNRSLGNPATFRPEIDLAHGRYCIVPSTNPYHDNYYGDYTPPVSSGTIARPVTPLSFVSPGINEMASQSVYNDLLANGIIDSAGYVEPTFNGETDLSFLFAGAPPADKAILIPEVQMILQYLLNTDTPATPESFIVPPITDSISQGVYNDLLAHSIINDNGDVEKYFTSTTDLSFLFAGAGERDKALLIPMVQRVLFHHKGSPVMYGLVDTQNAASVIVKNQPGSFMFKSGEEAFLNRPKDDRYRSLSEASEIRSVFSKPMLYEDSFVTTGIDASESAEVYSELRSHNIISSSGQLNPSFNADTDLSFLFSDVEDPIQRTFLTREVQMILLTLPSITGLRYYQDNSDYIVTSQSFVTTGIDATASGEVYSALKTAGIVNQHDIVYRDYSESTDLSFLFPNEAEPNRSVLTAKVREILFRYYNAFWVTNVHDLEFKVIRLSTGAITDLSRRLFSGGVSSLLSLESQQIPVEPILPFKGYLPGPALQAPKLADGAQVDFDGPYGLYYWELFYFAPFLIASSLNNNKKFDAAMKWYQYIFNPTAPEYLLQPDSFVTEDIDRRQSEEAYAQLVEHGVIDAEGNVDPAFNSSTNLYFLFPQVSDPARRALMIEEVRNVLLNYLQVHPTSRYWQFQPLRNHTLQSLQDNLTNPAQILMYNDKPFDPFAIARLRIGAFEKTIVMHYIDNLLDWGDALFSQYSWEAITAATMLYQYAAELLGARPESLGACTTEEPVNFNEMMEQYQNDPHGIPQFLIDMENVSGTTEEPDSLDLRGKPFNDIQAYFCVPENAAFVAYWDRLEDRLYKIHHCLNIEGQRQPLPLFQAPIDPMALVRAAASNNGSIDLFAQLQPAIPYYRFTAMIAQARNVVSTLTQQGASLLSALEKKDAEDLALMRSQFEITTLDMTSRIKEEQVNAARQTLESMERSAETVRVRAEYYREMLAEGLSSWERGNLNAMTAGLVFNVLASALRAVSSVGHMAPQIGSPFAMTYGGVQIGAALGAASGVAEIGSVVSSYEAQRSATMGSYERRSQEWTLQLQVAEAELRQIEKQIEAAATSVKIAERDQSVHERNLQQAREQEEFLTHKFSNRELYQWMVGRIATLYYQTYQVALDLALAAQRAYQWELGRDDSFVNFGYWDSLRKGLLAGEGLMLSLQQMEKAYTDNNLRRLEIERTISLVQLDAAEFIRFQETGECSLRLTEELFDYDFPGQYCRQVKSISISIPAVVGPYQNVKAMLTQTKNTTVLAPEPAAVRYLIDPAENGNPPSSLRTNWVPNQQVALSKGTDDNGLFVLDFNDARYLPFEGTGAVSEWTLSMPKETNRIEFNSISDVIIQLRYTALDGGEVFSGAVKDILAERPFAAGKYFNIRQAFASQWFAFMSEHPDPDSQTLQIPIAAGVIPPNLNDVELQSVHLKLDVAEGYTLPASSEFLMLKIVDRDAVPVPFSESLGAVNDLSIPYDDFIGEWQIVVDLAAMREDPELHLLLSDGFLNPEAFLNLEMILEYTACVFGDCNSST